MSGSTGASLLKIRRQKQHTISHHLSVVGEAFFNQCRMGSCHCGRVQQKERDFLFTGSHTVIQRPPPTGFPSSYNLQ